MPQTKPHDDEEECRNVYKNNTDDSKGQLRDKADTVDLVREEEKNKERCAILIFQIHLKLYFINDQL